MTRRKGKDRPRTRWSGQDFLSAAGAAYLASEIRNYWATIGHSVQTRTSVLDPTALRPVWIVRSDLISGLPQNFNREHFALIAADARDVVSLQREVSV